MTSYKKTLEKVLQGTSDANIRFNDLRNLLTGLGFKERIRGSHHIYSIKGGDGTLNLQPRDSKAKAYQVRQVRQIILELNLVNNEEDE
jgi:predicted RNA binding protein YcfA (HicA-like mRNA interferase family)